MTMQTMVAIPCPGADGTAQTGYRFVLMMPAAIAPVRQPAAATHNTADLFEAPAAPTAP